MALIRNAAIPGDTTGHMLYRLNRDVLDLHPDVLCVLGGTNDVGYGVPDSVVVDNIRRIVEKAQGQGVSVVLLTIPPNNQTDVSGRRHYTAINADLAALGQEVGILIVDVHSVLATPDGGLRGDYAADDGLHLTVSGEQAIADAVYRALHPAEVARTD
jgi:lysophospholipase L1-like esterase